MVREPEPTTTGYSTPTLAGLLILTIMAALFVSAMIVVYSPPQPQSRLITVGNPDHPECSVKVDSRVIADLAKIGIYEWADTCERLRLTNP